MILTDSNPLCSVSYNGWVSTISSFHTVHTVHTVHTQRKERVRERWGTCTICTYQDRLADGGRGGVGGALEPNSYDEWVISVAFFRFPLSTSVLDPNMEGLRIGCPLVYAWTWRTVKAWNKDERSPCSLLRPTFMNWLHLLLPTANWTRISYLISWSFFYLCCRSRFACVSWRENGGMGGGGGKLHERLAHSKKSQKLNRNL